MLADNGRGWLIQRRYSQFYQLDCQMKKMFTGTPKIPPKKIGVGKMSPIVVEARQNALEVYLQFLLDDTITRNALPLKEFLLNNPLLASAHESMLSDSEESLKPKKKRKKKKSSKRKRAKESNNVEELSCTAIEETTSIDQIELEPESIQEETVLQME